MVLPIAWCAAGSNSLSTCGLFQRSQLVFFAKLRNGFVLSSPVIFVSEA